MSTIPVITLWQPWASLVAHDKKKIETRSWATSYRGPLAIHSAAKPFDTRAYLDRELYPFADALNLPDYFSFDTLPYGCVIAVAELVDCLEIHEDGLYEMIPSDQPGLYDLRKKCPLPKGNELAFGDYAPGRYAWILSNIRKLDKPIPAKGQQGLWRWKVPEGVGVRLCRQR